LILLLWFSFGDEPVPLSAVKAMERSNFFGVKNGKKMVSWDLEYSHKKE
jgi:hypothetical protein